MLNTRLLNPHDIIIIAAIAIVVNVVLVPLYHKIEGNTDNG